MHRHRANISEADKSLWERADAVCRAIMAVYGPTPGLMPTMERPEDCCYVKEVFDAYAIVEKAERYYRIDYTMAADGTVTLSDPVEVEEIYKPVAETARLAHDGADPAKAGAPVEISESHGGLLEATSETGSSWRVLLIKAGLSGNGRRYPAEVLQQAAPLFEGVKAYADHPSSDEKRHRPERSIRDVVGWYSNVAWSDEHNGLTADFHLVESADWLRQSLKSSWDKGKPDLLGFSINASGVVKRQPDGTALLEGFESVVSTDVVTTPGAGGRLLGVLESERSSERVMDPEEIKRLIQESLAASTTSLMAAFDARLSAIAKPAAEPIVEAKPADEVTQLRESIAALTRETRKVAISARIDDAKLPAAHAAKLKTRLLEAASRRDVDDAEVDAEIGYLRELIAESAPARPSWGGQPVMESGDDFRDKFSKGIEGFFSGQDVDGVPRFKNLHQMDMRWQTGMGARNYDPTAINGMSLMESLRPATRYWNADSTAILESLTTSSWGEVFADNLYKMMLREYNAVGKYSAWRALISEIESVPSFQTRHFTRTGGYGNIPTVSESGTYLSLTSPADEEITYAIAKRGGLEDLTFEMLQDPTAAGKIRTIPTKMARSAARTLYTFVFNDLLANNPTMDYDSTALFAAGHANTDTSAGLSVSALQTGRQKMRDQAAYGESLEILGDLNTPRYLLVPNELQAIADRICNSNHPQLQMTVTSNQDTSQVLDPNMFRGMLTPIVVDIWSDANDWMLVADPSQVNTIVLGFLNGREEPEMFVQDNPTVGSAFTADKITYKIRHIYGGDVADHRSFYRGQG